uniref:Uncharacterized protein n=1 Tax=Meleagris gallopavo TaxID=9103 RepID=A0A803Y0N9_MELGA
MIALRKAVITIRAFLLKITSEPRIKKLEPVLLPELPLSRHD